MPFLALLRHFSFPSPNNFEKASTISLPITNRPTEVQPSSVGKWYTKMGNKNCWEALGEEREKFKILGREIQDQNILWGSSSTTRAIPTWGLYMIGLTPQDAVPWLLVCCDDKSVRKEMRRSIESSGILAEKEYHHIRLGDCEKPPEFGPRKNRLRTLSGRQEKEYSNAASDYDDSISVKWGWDTHPGKMEVTFKNVKASSVESINQCSVLGMAFQHLGKIFAITASHTLVQDLRSSLDVDKDEDEDDTSDLEFEFDLENDRDAEYSDPCSHNLPIPYRGDDAIPVPGWGHMDKVFLCDHDLDFALLREHDTYSVSRYFSPLPSLQQLLQKANREPEDAVVTAVTASNGHIEGRLSGTPSFIRLPYATCFQEVWTVQFNSELAPGDSGSLVVDANSGRVFGHIVAGASASGVAYIIPAFKVLERIQLFLRSQQVDNAMSVESHAAREGGRSYPRRNSTSSLPFDRLNTNACIDERSMNKRVIALTAVGFFVDSYNLFATTAVQPIMAITLGVQNPGRFGVILNLAVLLTVPLGALIAGVVADLFGRRKMYGMELILLIVGIFGLVLTDTRRASFQAIPHIIFWRMIMGLGLGGEYPLSAVITAEFTPKRRSATMLSVVFLAQGIGKLAAIITTILVLSPLHHILSQMATANPKESSIQEALDKAWRLVIGFGALPAIAALFFRLRIPESPRYCIDVLGVAPDPNEADFTFCTGSRILPSRKLPEFLRGFFGFVRQASAWRVLVGISAAWFFSDFAFYGLGMNGGATMDRLWSINTTREHNLPLFLAEWKMQLLLELPVGAILGSILALFVLGKAGSQMMQMAGFVALGAIFILTRVLHYYLGAAFGGRGALFAMYTAAQMAFNFGPNTMTFIIPAELFPTQYRATAYGIAAASGKVGAILAQFLYWNFSSSSSVMGTGTILVLFAVLSFLGALVTWSWVPESTNWEGKILQNSQAGTRKGLYAGVERTLIPKQV